MKKLFEIFGGFSSRISNEQNRGHSNEPPRDPPKMDRHFEFERKQYPWLPPSGYTPVQGYNPESNNVRVAPWGRKYTDHAIEATQPSGFRYSHNGPHDSGPHQDQTMRSIPPVFVEHTIAYGERIIDKGRVNYRLGDITVGVSPDESIVHHIKYTHD